MQLRAVAPFTGAWIEIHAYHFQIALNLSLPSRERGLKFMQTRKGAGKYVVAPFTGAWIEIIWFVQDAKIRSVAPFTGAWIEILSLRPDNTFETCRSLHGSVD